MRRLVSVVLSGIRFLGHGAKFVGSVFLRLLSIPTRIFLSTLPASVQPSRQLRATLVRGKGVVALAAGVLLLMLVPVAIWQLTAPSRQAEAAWFDGAYGYRQLITFGNTGSADANKKVKLDIDTATLITAGKLQSDCDDVRFTDYNGKILRFYLDSAGGACNTSSTDFYVLVETIYSGTTNLYFYYSNPTAGFGGENAQFSESTFTPTSGPTFGSEALTPGPKLYWKFDDGNATVVHDSTSNNLDGTYSSIVTKPVGECVVGACIETNGGSDYVNAGDVAFLDGLSQMTVSFWVNPSVLDLQDYLISKYGNNQNSFLVRVASADTDELRFVVSDALNDGGTNYALTTNLDLQASTWSYLTFVFDGTQGTNSNRVRIYKNLKPISFTTNGSFPSTLTTGGTAELQLGNVDSGGTAAFFAKYDEVKIYPYAISSTQMQEDYNNGALQAGLQPQASQALLSRGLTGYWGLDELATTSTDNSGGGNTATWAGNTTMATGKFGTSLAFDGTGDYASTALAWTSSGSVSTWVYPTSYTAWKGPVGWKNAASSQYALIDMGGSGGTGNWRAAFLPASSGTEATVQSSTAITQNAWSHVVMTWELSGSTYTIKLYVNGVAQGSTTWTGTPGTLGGFYMGTTGAQGSANSNDFPGRVDETRVYNRALSQPEVVALSSSSPGPKVFLKMDEDYWSAVTNQIKDSSGNSFHATPKVTTTIANGTSSGSNTSTTLNDTAKTFTTDALIGMVIETTGGTGSGQRRLVTTNTTTQITVDQAWATTPDATTTYKLSPTTTGNGKIGKAGLFGQNRVIGITNNAAFLPASNLTWSFWVNSSSLASTQSINRAGLNSFWSHTITINTSGKLLASVNNGTTTTSITGSATMVTNTWYYVSLVIDTSGNFYTYINGVLDGSNTYTGTLDAQRGATMPIGSGDYQNITGTFAGQIDEAKMYNYVRTPAQIIEDMNEASPSNQTLTSSTFNANLLPQPVVHYSLNEQQGQIANNKGSGGSALNGTLGANSSASTDDPTWKIQSACKLNGCQSFDGADYILTADTNALDLPDDLTVSAWVYRTTASGNQSIIAKTAASSSNVNYEMIINITTGALGWWDGTNLRTSGVTIPLNTWTHVAGVLNGTSLSYYMNGNKLLTQTVADQGSQDGPLYIGRDRAGANLTGLIDEVKIYNTALTADQVKMDYNAGSSQNFGAIGAGASSLLSGGAGNAPVGYWKMDEKAANTCTGGSNDVCDYSGNGNDGNFDTAASTWKAGKVGSAVDFGTSGSDRISVTDPANGSLDFGASQDFSLTGWIYRNVGTGTPAILGKRTGISSGTGYVVVLNNNNLELRTHDGVDTYTVTGSTSLATLNQWYHYAVVWDDDSAVRLYVNGALQTLTTSGTLASIGDMSNSSNFNIGAVSGTSNFYGRVDETKVFNYALDPAQVAYEFNSGAPLARWKMDECQGTSILDSSGNNLTGTLTVGASGTQASAGTCQTSSTAWGNGVTGKYNASLNFDGTDDRVDLDAYTASMPTGTSPVSVSAWAKWPSTPAQNRVVFAFGGFGTDQGYALQYTQGVGLEFKVGSNGRAISSVTPTGGQWYHLVGVYNRSTNLVYIYINGQLKDTTAWSSNIVSPPTLRIGHDDSGSNYRMQGQIDDVAVYNYALSAAQVNLLYNQGAAVRFGPSSGSP